MYTKNDYLPIREKMRNSLVTILRSDKVLYENLVKISGQYDDGTYLIELALFWGQSCDKGGCFRFHLMINFQHGLRGKVVYLYITHVPQTDNGYDWEGGEIHLHNQDPFGNQPFIANSFLEFMSKLSDPAEMIKVLRGVENHGRLFHKPKFVDALEALKGY